MPSDRRPLAHPGLWATATAAAVRLVPRRGRSARPWLRFRMETAYGSGRTRPDGHDVVTFLRWLRAWPRVRS